MLLTAAHILKLFESTAAAPDPAAPADPNPAAPAAQDPDAAAPPLQTQTQSNDAGKEPVDMVSATGKGRLKVWNDSYSSSDEEAPAARLPLLLSVMILIHQVMTRLLLLPLLVGHRASMGKAPASMGKAPASMHLINFGRMPLQ